MYPPVQLVEAVKLAFLQARIKMADVVKRVISLSAVTPLWFYDVLQTSQLDQIFLILLEINKMCLKIKFTAIVI